MLGRGAWKMSCHHATTSAVSFVHIPAVRALHICVKCQLTTRIAEHTSDMVSYVLLRLWSVVLPVSVLTASYCCVIVSECCGMQSQYMYIDIE